MTNIMRGMTFMKSKLNFLKYNTKQGFKNIKNNRIYSLASISTMCACIFLLGLFFALLVNINKSITEAEKSVGITVFFDENINEERVYDIGWLIEQREEVDSIYYVSSDEAWNDFQEVYFEEDPELAEGFADENPLANSDHYEIYLKDISKQNDLVEYINSLDGIRKINQSEDMASVLTDFNELLKKISFAITIILVCVSIFLICNTIISGINHRYEEIAIMKLMGATNRFVMFPFLIEGAIIGTLGSIIPISILYYVYTQLSTYLANEFSLLTGIINFIPCKELYYRFTPIVISISIFSSVLCSYFVVKYKLVSTKKYRQKQRKNKRKRMRF